jgi:hypothetical protein
MAPGLGSSRVKGFIAQAAVNIQAGADEFYWLPAADPRLVAGDAEGPGRLVCVCARERGLWQYSWAAGGAPPRL